MNTRVVPARQIATITIIEYHRTGFVMMQTQALLALPQDEDETRHVIEHMATAIAEHLEKNGQCRIADMCAMGFSLSDVTRYWPEACKLAESKRPRPLPR